VSWGDATIDGTRYRVFDNGNAGLLVNMEMTPGENLMATGRVATGEILQDY